jgi:hypothetical protein
MAAISSLNEAWCHTLDEYVGDAPLNEVILPLMRNCFFGGAIYTLLLLQKGHSEQLAADIAGFATEKPKSWSLAHAALTWLCRAKMLPKH